MKVLHLEAGRHLYGGARQVGYLINGLAGKGVNNVLVCNKEHALAGQVSAKVYEWRLGGDVDFTLTRRLAKLAAKTRPDIVHVHSRRGADTFGGRAAKAAGIPAILTRRVLSAEPGIWLRYKCAPYQTVVAISSAVRDELRRFGIAEERLRMIPSAVDTVLFGTDSGARARVTERYGLPGDALIAASAGQLIRRKAQSRLIPLAARLIGAEPRFRLLLFGQGPERPRLEREVSRLGLGRHVTFAGFEPDWPELVAGFDLVLHPARREGLGAAVLEAMSAGRPVVASAVGGLCDVIEDGINGRLVSPDAPDAWHDAVLDLLGNPDLRRRIGAAARQSVEANFTIEQMTQSYLALYREVLGDGRA